tara:strand:- start:84 stop:611 length:528 start_codon:yes stop_codon:yes gene_type:complete
MKKLSPILFSIFFLTLISNLFSQEKFISGNVKVIDGDTIIIKNERIRLHGIDAPEMKQICYKKNNLPYPCGLVAKDFLENFIIARINDLDPIYKDIKTYCYYSERDRYKRIIGKCFLGKDSKVNLNHAMVFTGNAVAYTKYSKDYVGSQKRAEQMKAGIWQGNFIMPEEWRRKNK